MFRRALQGADPEGQRSAYDTKCRTAENVFGEMHPCNDADACERCAKDEQQDACRYKVIKPERSDQKYGKHVPAGKRLPCSVSRDERNNVKNFVGAGTVDKFTDPAHGQEEKGRYKQDSKKTFVPVHSDYEQKQGI